MTEEFHESANGSARGLPAGGTCWTTSPAGATRSFSPGSGGWRPAPWVYAIGLDVAGVPLSEATLTFLGIAVPDYLVVEGGLDFIARRASDRKKGEE